MGLSVDYFMSFVEDGAEITVFDKDYDLEVYFYPISEDTDDEWDKAMSDIYKGLNVTKIKLDGSIEVDMYDAIEQMLPKLEEADLFNECDTEAIMDDMENILAGNVSENWLRKFADVMKERKVD